MRIAETISFEDFLGDVPVQYKAFVSAAHGLLAADGYRIKIESKASGLFVSYAHPKTKRSILNFFFRKKGFFARMYADNLGRYTEFLSNLPENMEKEIAKASVCKRMLNPQDCNPKCIMGYDFHIRETHYQKCRYNCFQFAVNEESAGVLSAFIQNEIEGRSQGQ